jgi:hypothetical protein
MKSSQSENSKKLLCISYVFPPLINPLANRVQKLLVYFQKTWQIQAVTGRDMNAYLNEKASVHFVKSWYPKRLIELMSKLKMGKFLGLLIWPDSVVFWVLPALLKGYQLIKAQKPDAIIVFMMPYSTGLAGIGLKWLTGIPLILSFDDSISCTDMHPDAPSRLHYQLGIWLENFYVRQADAVVYVSQFNLELVKKRQPLSQHSKFHLIRCGVDILDFTTPISAPVIETTFEIVYTGGMNGWYPFYHSSEELTVLKKLYKAWIKLGHYQLAKIDYRTSSPVFIGQAVQQAIEQCQSWRNRINVKLYGNKVSEAIVQQVLQNQNLTDVVSVFGAVPHSQAIQLARQADLLFLTLPKRTDGSSGGRISCKSYEYLMTDRPILAAVPKGENWNYLQDKPGVWLVEPTDIETMSKVVAEVASAKFSGRPLSFDRTPLQQELSYFNLAEEYLKIFERVGSNSTTMNSLSGSLKT